MPVAVTGLRDLNAALAKADRATRLGVRAELRQVGEPVRSDAQQLAGTAIPRMAHSPAWAGMRVGVTRSLVYVAPRKRGTRGRTPRSRPNLAQLLMARAMEPALRRHEGQTVERFDDMLDRVADRFNHGAV